MYYRLFSLAVIASLTLSACSSVLPISGNTHTSVQEQPSALSQRAVLGSALYKRTLQLATIDGQVVPIASVSVPTQASFSTKQVKTAITIAEPALTRPAIEPGFYYGGNDFNQYMIQYAEENLYPAPQGNSLLDVYKNDIEPILAEWDATGRLVETRAQINGNEIEYIYLPGQEGEPLELKPDYIFRFASSPKKETLNIYVMPKEIRVHRMIWGEPEIEIKKVKIDSDQALSIAEKAFANQDKKPGYPVYPDQNERNVEIIYDLPNNLQWQLYLNQQSQNEMRYFLNFQFVRKVKASSVPTSSIKDSDLDMPKDDQSVSNDNSSSGSNSSPGSVMQSPEAYYDEYLYGSAEIDAITGKILSLNRPVIYNRYGDSGGAAVSSGYAGEVAVNDAGPETSDTEITR